MMFSRQTEFGRRLNDVMQESGNTEKTAAKDHNKISKRFMPDLLFINLLVAAMCLMNGNSYFKLKREQLV
jgi:hypothetical protein